MDVPYPDIIGEYTDAPTRNEVNGLQYVILYEPKEIIGGEEATVILYLQNLLNVPMKVAINAVVPKVGFLFKKVPFLLIDSEKIELELSPAEVGILNIPAVVSNKGGVSKPNKIEFRFKVKPIGRRSKRVRTPVKTSLIPAYLIDDPVGLNLVGVLGASYKINKKGKKHVLEIPVASNRESDPSDEVETFMYQLLWTMDDYERLIEAHNIINEQRDNIIPVLNLESVFAMMYVEGKNRFDNVGLPLRVGEAIALGKLLAHAATFFLEKPDMQDAVLRPVWNNALRKKIFH
ncbi:MAG: hypothetical protein B6242_05555 [Anaerolineaceae bacterium 4572_78]|nr:MAG: hypothetical protein B6242_05555 [Anaerolineaceae bacterium 4572_78]